MRPANANITNGGTFPSQTSSTSNYVWSASIVRASFQISVSSGSLNGTFTLKGSNDLATDNPSLTQFAPTNWAVVGGSTSVICSNSTAGSGAFLIGETEMAYEYIRLDFTAGNSGAALGTYQIRMKSLSL